MTKRINKAQFLVSTKADLLTEKVNEFLAWCEDNNRKVISVSPFMSYAGLGKNNVGGYMIGCMVQYSYLDFSMDDIPFAKEASNETSDQ